MAAPSLMKTCPRTWDMNSGWLRLVPLLQQHIVREVRVSETGSFDKGIMYDGYKSYLITSVSSQTQTVR